MHIDKFASFLDVPLSVSKSFYDTEDDWEALLISDHHRTTLDASNLFANTVLSKCASEIEKAFISALILSFRSMCFSISANIFKEEASPYRAYITNQHKVGKYKTDFLIEVEVDDRGEHITSDDTAYASVCIECDGHDYHERTKEQAKKDRARDRYFTDNGVQFFRFTGSEIYANAFDCANQTVNFLHKNLKITPQAELKNIWKENYANWLGFYESKP